MNRNTQLYVVIAYWPDGTVSHSVTMRGFSRAWRCLQRMKSLARTVELVTAREAGHRKMVSDYVSEGLGEV